MSKVEGAQKLIPIIYYYLLSAVGMVLIIIGLFNTFNYVTGVTIYEKYPLNYGNETRCDYMPSVIKEENISQPTREDCLQGLEAERKKTQADDLKNAIAFTSIGILVFSLHFYFARKSTH